MKINIRGGIRVQLRLLQNHDISGCLQQLSHVIRHTLYIASHVAELTYSTPQYNVSSDTMAYVYAIIDIRSDTLIGALEAMPYSLHSGQLYIWLDELYWEVGYFQEVMQSMSKLHFHQETMPLITAHIDICDTQSYTAFKKAGFKESAIFDGLYGKQYILCYR